MSAATDSVVVRRHGDTVAFLTVFVGLLILIPARLVFAPLGGAGRPAVIFGAVGAVWWGLDRILPKARSWRPNLVRQVIWLHLAVFGLTWTLGYGRGLPADEARATDRALIATLALTGVALLAADGIRDRRRLDVLLQRLTVLGAVLAVVGIVQFVTGVDLARKIVIPGLSLNRELYGIGQRGGPQFNRVAGTATHPIEFGVVCALLLPLALHYALFARSRVERQWRWIAVMLLALAVPFSLSRSGTVALVAGLLVLLPAWTRRIRHQALLVMVAGMVLLRSTIPGLLGTIRSLFKNLGSDPSVQGRTDDYDTVLDLVSQRPWFGRGPRTFLPEKYIVLDNQFLDTLVTMGAVGVFALALLFLGPLAVARRIHRSDHPEETRHLGRALAAGLLAATLTSFTFDSFSFPMFSGCLFLLIGCTGALLRLSEEGPRAPVGEELRVLRPRVARAPWLSELAEPSRSARAGR